MSKVFIADYENKQLVEKATIRFPHQLIEKAFDKAKAEYDQHIASLAKYPASWLTKEMDGKEFMEGMDFEVRSKMSNETEGNGNGGWKFKSPKYAIPLSTPSEKERGITITEPLPIDQQPEEDSAYLQSKSDKPVAEGKEHVLKHNFYVMRDYDNQYTVWTKSQYEQYIIGAVMVGGGSAYKLVVGFWGNEDYLLRTTHPKEDVEQAAKNYAGRTYNGSVSGEIVPISAFLAGASWQAKEPLLADGLLDILVWYQGRGDEYREQTLLVDCVKDFLTYKNKLNP